MFEQWVPLVILLILAAIGVAIGKVENGIRRPENPYWPYAAKPGLALELATAGDFVDRLLGPQGALHAAENRNAARRIQLLDCIFIPLYVAFFIATAQYAWWVAALAIATGLADYIEDYRIWKVLYDATFTVSQFGKVKWSLYFLTIAAEGLYIIQRGLPHDGYDVAAWLLALFLLAVGGAGLYSSVRGIFDGILSATSYSAIGLLGLGLGPAMRDSDIPWGEVAQYIFWMRVPVVTGVLLVLLPVIAFHTPAKSLLRGLFDLTPGGILFVTLAAIGVAGSCVMNVSLILLRAHDRFAAAGHEIRRSPTFWLCIMAGLVAFLIPTAVGFSIRQKHPPGKCIGAAVIGVVFGFGVSWWLAQPHPALSARIQAFIEPADRWMAGTGLFAGYANPNVTPSPLLDHLQAGAGFASTLGLYLFAGFWGYFRLGRDRTVPALCSALMVMLMMTWMVSGAAFFFDAWRIPVLLILAAGAVLTSQSTASDHTYKLLTRTAGAATMPDPSAAINATGQRRIVVVAASGGGIQAGAWTAQVLEGLDRDHSKFRQSLRLISSVSGGSVGAAHFVQWLANPEDSQTPARAAAESSLDEVAWGLAWPDFLRSLFPWISRKLIGRGRALEFAWRRNGSLCPKAENELIAPLSNWNQRTAQGELPAVVMNATISESGERLLLATTGMGAGAVAGRARIDGSTLHTINNVTYDVGVVTAARLSASFTYVTPAARSDKEGPQPHVVDGGYYDNYGIATLVEWLDAALTGAQGSIDAVLVVQTRGIKVGDLKDKRFGTTRGWFYQAIAPIATLEAVRNAGQVAHDAIELHLLQEKWKGNVAIDSVLFEFPDEEAPLSWHLTQQQIDAIQTQWNDTMTQQRALVAKFLETDTNQPPQLSRAHSTER